MPLRPDLTSGLNLSRRATTPVKLPKMNFPMLGGVPESAPGHAEPAHQPLPGAVEGTVPMPEEVQPMPMMSSHPPMMPGQQSMMPGQQPMMPAQPMSSPAPAPATPANTAARVVIYGRSGCAASMDAIADLVERQVNFTYYDVGRDAKAMGHLQAICGAGESVVVPVIMYIGYGGT